MSKKIPLPVKRLVVVFFFMVLLPLSSVSLAQTVDINLVDTEVYPRIKVYVTVVDAKGDVVCKLDPTTFRLREHGKSRNLNVLYGEATETSIGVLLDCSGSMHGVIDDVKTAAKQFIELLGGSDRACTYSFDDSLHRLYSMIDISVGTNKSALTRSLDNYSPGGGTSMYSAINDLIKQEMAKETERRKAIVALTDGVSSGLLKTALDATSKYNAAVYTIGMGSVDARALQELAEKSGGKFYAVSAKPTPQELTAVYKDIRNRLNCQYTLIYETTDVCPDGADVPIQVFVDRFGTSKQGTYKRPHDPARIVHNIFFAPQNKPHLVVIPDNPMECEVVEFHTSIQSTSCSDDMVLKNIVVRAYDVKPGDRIEVAKSDPFEIQSNSNPKKVVVKWNTRGYTGTRQIELIIDPSDEILERIEEDNLMKTTVNISKATHDLYIQDIDYSPKPASPCKTVDITVKVSDGCTCQGVKSNEILIEAIDDKKQSFGTDIVSVTSGTLSEVKFQWDPGGRIGHIPLTFKLDPRSEFGQEQTRENNNMQKLIEVSPVLHELKPTQVTHPQKRYFVGDEIPFSVNIENAGICASLKMHQNIRIRLKEAESNRILGHSAPFSLETQTSIIVPINWETKRNDHGTKKVKFTVDQEGIIREQTPPGKTNNSIEYEVEILPMPHDLIIKSAALEPERPVDGDPATLKVLVEDNARFDGIKLPKKFKLRAVERYTGMTLGTSEPADIFSRQTAEIEFRIDTGGLAGQREILVEVDPDNEIQELTPNGLDGENNNEYILKVIINE
jgi:VWFA-related protein